jgi:Na+(H+)/acetate symporter ActP
MPALLEITHTNKTEAEWLIQRLKENTVDREFAINSAYVTVFYSLIGQIQSAGMIKLACLYFCGKIAIAIHWLMFPEKSQ